MWERLRIPPNDKSLLLKMQLVRVGLCSLDCFQIKLVSVLTTGTEVITTSNQILPNYYSDSDICTNMYLRSSV